MRKRSLGYGAVTKLQHAATIACAVFVLLTAQTVLAIAETRTLNLFNAHTKERVQITFKKNGRYIPSGLREANRFLRDWRRNEITKIDPKLLDLIWEVYQKVGATKPIHVVSSYRSPATNNMLRRRSKGVAKRSQHMLGKAMDYFIPGVPLATLRKTGLRKQVGGVGYYPTSGSPFVHMDTGNVRHWPRMTRKQLAAVFPDGKTLHIPSDGKPLAGYKLALAEARSGKRRTTPKIQVAARAPERRDQTTGHSLTNRRDTKPSSGTGFFASLFNRDKNTKEAERSRVAAVRPNIVPAPPEVLPGVKPVVNASPAESEAPVTVAPPIPVQEDRIVVAGIVPARKPVRAPVLASAVPNTLDAQRITLQQGGTTGTPAPAPGRFEIASASDAATFPGRKPVLSAPQTLDPVSAIAAATGTSKPQVKPAAPTTLAYASATAKASSLPEALEMRAKAAQSASINGAARPNQRPQLRQSVSGRIPPQKIQDPLAGFASLPDKTEPKLISSRAMTRNQQFASLRHPFQRSMNSLLTPGNRFMRSGFERFPYGALRTDRFDGPAVVILPVAFTR